MFTPIATCQAFQRKNEYLRINTCMNLHENAEHNFIENDAFMLKDFKALHILYNEKNGNSTFYVLRLIRITAAVILHLRIIFHIHYLNFYAA